MWKKLASLDEFHTLRYVSISGSKNPSIFTSSFFSNPTLWSLSSFNMEDTSIDYQTAKAIKAISPHPFFVKDSQAYHLLHGPVLPITLHVQEKMPIN